MVDYRLYLLPDRGVNLAWVADAHNVILWLPSGSESRDERNMSEERIVFAGLRCRNYDGAVRFYRDVLGVPLREEDHPPEGLHSEHSWHNPYFHFAIFRAAAGDEPTRAELSFSTRDVLAVHARAVAAGIHVIEAPRQQPWGFSASYLDPDGNSVGVTELAKGKS
jgi:predicted enzyme related to lactoylglutathione lyase